jgi:anti-anti-sigma factor
MTSATLPGTNTQVAPQTDSLRSGQGKDSLTISVADVDRGFLLRFAGRAGVANLRSMELLFLRTVAQRPQVVVLDFSQLTVVSSLAIGLLISLRRDLARWCGRVKIAASRPLIRESLEIAGLANLFEFHATVDDALAPA